MNLALFGDGKLELDITGNRASHNQYPLSPLPYAEDALLWLGKQMETHAIPSAELVRACLIVDYRVEWLERKGPIPAVNFDFECLGVIDAPDRTYESKMHVVKNWGLGQV